MPGEDRALEQLLAEEDGDERHRGSAHRRERLAGCRSAASPIRQARARRATSLGGGQCAEHADKRLDDPEVGVALAGELVACVASVGEPVAEVVHPQRG